MSERLSAEDDAHAGCHEAWERQLRRAQFAEARLESLVSDLRQLAHEFDGIEGHRTHAALGGKTLGGAIRNLVNGEAIPRPIPPAATTQ